MYLGGFYQFPKFWENWPKIGRKPQFLPKFSHKVEKKIFGRKLMEIQENGPNGLKMCINVP